MVPSVEGSASSVLALECGPSECLQYPFLLSQGMIDPHAGMLWRWQQTAHGWRCRHSCAGACMRSTAATTLRPCQGSLQGSSPARSYGAMS